MCSHDSTCHRILAWVPLVELVPIHLTCLFFLSAFVWINFEFSMQQFENRGLQLSVGHKGNNKITEHRAIFQRERQNSYVNRQFSQQPENWKTAMALTWYWHFQRNCGLNQILRRHYMSFELQLLITTLVSSHFSWHSHVCSLVFLLPML